MPLVYQELHQRAERYMAYEQPGHTLQTTALVNELYLRLVDLPRQNWENRSHFLAICAQLMRRILVDFARSRRSQKRGGGPGDLPLNEALTVCNEAPHEIIAVDDALKSLSAFDPRKARVVELRFFGGLGVEETADILKISAETVMLRLEDGESLADSGSEERRKACRLSAGAGSKICIMPRYSSK